MKTKSLKRRLFFLKCGSFATSFAPVVTAIIINWSKYVNTNYSGIKLGIGGVLGIAIMFIQAVGKVKISNRLLALTIIFVLAFLLDSILQDLLLLSGCALIGELISLGFLPFEKKTEEQINDEKTSTVVTTAAKQVAEEIKNINLRG